MKDISIKRLGKNLIKIHKHIESVAPNKMIVYCLSDVHFDNPKCNRDLFFRHMDKAKAEGALIIFNGDFFCMMEGRHDPRRSKKGVRPEYNDENYVDLVVNDAFNQLLPYKDHLACFGYGNHETSVLKNLNTDLIGRLVHSLRREGSKVQKGFYSGYIQVAFTTSYSTRENKVLTKKTIGYHHGKYGGVISKGVQGTMRHAAIMPDADIMLTGHTHDQWLMNQPRFKLNNQTGDVEQDNIWHLRTGTYKSEFVDMMGWATEKIVTPKAMGMWRIEFDFLNVMVDKKRTRTIDTTINNLN